MALKDELRTRLAEQAQTIAALRERVAACVAALKEAQDNYHGACKTVAEMHEATTGRRGEAPYRGVVEDCAQVRAERDNWEATANQHCRNEQYYRSLVVKIGEIFGVAARTCDDGSISEDVLCAKVPELVAALRERESFLEAALALAIQNSDNFMKVADKAVEQAAEMREQLAACAAKIDEIHDKVLEIDCTHPDDGSECAVCLAIRFIDKARANLSSAAGAYRASIEAPLLEWVARLEEALTEAVEFSGYRGHGEDNENTYYCEFCHSSHEDDAKIVHKEHCKRSRWKAALSHAPSTWLADQLAAARREALKGAARAIPEDVPDDCVHVVSDINEPCDIWIQAEIQNWLLKRAEATRPEGTR